MYIHTIVDKRHEAHLTWPDETICDNPAEKTVWRRCRDCSTPAQPRFRFAYLQTFIVGEPDWDGYEPVGIHQTTIMEACCDLCGTQGLCYRESGSVGPPETLCEICTELVADADARRDDLIEVEV